MKPRARDGVILLMAILAISARSCTVMGAGCTGWPSRPPRC
jgi:hypothetical protein